MESKLRKTPLLPFYVFKQSFECLENFEDIQRNICEYIEKAKNPSWFEFWETQGEEIILRTWKLKFKDYINETSAEVVITNTKVDVNTHGVEEEQVSQIDTDDQNNQAWQELWEEHTQEIYAIEYQKFDRIYDNYYWCLKEAVDTEDKRNNKKRETFDEIQAELEQLRLAGLPTAFGSSQRDCSTKKCELKSRESTEESDSLTDSDYSEDSLYEIEMPPVAEDKHETTNVVMDSSSPNTNDNLLHKTKNKTISKSTAKKKHLKKKIPEFMLEDKAMLKYWKRRFSLFSRFDEGIRLDRESWFSVTPEKVAQHMAGRLACNVIVDGFCGSGGNAIQFAKTCNKVIAIDIDPLKIEMAKHNAAIYGVADKIEFIVGDFLEYCTECNIEADVVFLSPPWGGPAYKTMKTYDIESNLEPVGAKELVNSARNISNNIAIFLPRNSDIKQIVQVAGIGKNCEIEHNYLDTRVVGLTALYGDCVKK